MSRLISLDAVRGLTVAGMILVNNGYGQSFQPLRHAQWNGLSISDLVFPFFLFIMGVSLYLSMSSRGLDFSGSKLVKILRRSLLLFLIGVAINWIDMAVSGNPWNFSELRFWAVMQRIALCYFVAGIAAITLPPRASLPLAISFLIIYTLIIIFGNGYAFSAEENLLHRVDAFLFGESHLYRKSPVDPEGLVSTLSAIANTLFGYYCGMKIKETTDNREKVIRLFTIGTLLLFAGLLLSYAFPFNKRIWSPSFALATSGFCALLLALSAQVLDTNSCKPTTRKIADFCIAFGSNALVIYIASEIMAIFFGEFGVSDLIYNGCSFIIPTPKIASLLYAVIFVSLNYLIALILYRRRIFIKI